MKRKLSRSAETKMKRAAPYDAPTELRAPEAKQKKENIFVQSLQEAGLGDLAQTGTIPESSGVAPPKEEEEGAEESSESGSTESDESDGFADKWEDEMERCLKPILSKADTQKALRILKQLDEIEEFTLTKESVLYFKKKPLGNIYILFNAFFGGEKKDAQMFKQLQQFRKLLHANNVKVPQRKPYVRKTPPTPKKKKTKAGNDDDNETKEKPASPAVNQDLLNQLKK
jgi:hypothetical protein